MKGCPSRQVVVVGIGPGDPEQLTVQAVRALNQVRVFFVPDKGAEKDDLRRHRREICARFIEHGDYRVVEFAPPRRRSDVGGYVETVEEWHGRIADRFAALLLDELRDGELGGFLVWGDPSLYDSTLRVLDAVRDSGRVALDYEVIPGITSVQALAARHRIALNRVGGPVHITTGRRVAGGLPDGLDDVVVMLDGDQAFRHLDGADYDIFWGAYLGTADEILVAGRLSEVADDVERLRAEARARKGWIMDTYLLRRRPTP